MMVKRFMRTILVILSVLLTSCQAWHKPTTKQVSAQPATVSMPSSIHGIGEKVIVVDPRIHMWGAYSSSGYLVRSGMATAGAGWCADIKRSCRTKSGHFRIYSIGNKHCKSSKFPLPNGGAPMPYCMFFNGGQALHGSHQVVRGNVSHGCVRLHVPDAEWMKHQFVDAPSRSNRYRGTRVIIKPY